VPEKKADCCGKTDESKSRHLLDFYRLLANQMKSGSYVYKIKDQEWYTGTKIGIFVK